MTPGRPQFTLYSRPECELCEHLLMALQSQDSFHDWDVQVLDVDADPAARGRYGHKIPVLLLDGQLVCHGRLEPLELSKALAARG